jgi:hypothetical protein
MNLYIVVEGEVGEKYVYEQWINYCNPDLKPVKYLDEIENDHFIIYAGGGFPNYFEIIDNAILDVNEIDYIDRLVISVDTEDMTFDEKYDELKSHINGKKCRADIKIVIQHFCLETWALGNKKACPRNPKSLTLRKYKDFHNVLTKDPELLPPFPAEELNRSQFAEKYLRVMLNDKFRNLTYNKSNPKTLLHPSYYKQVKKRYYSTGHISSFSTFLDAFS